MSNYTKSTNFASKDALASGNPLKIVKGTEIDTEFNNIATAVATKTDNSSAAITGGTITGATINNAVIGGTTPAAGTFTTVTGGNGSKFTDSGKSIIFNPNYLGFGGNQITSIETGVGYLALTMMALSHSWTLNGSSTVMGALDANGNWIFNTNTTAATLYVNGHMTISRVNNTTLKLSLRGTDGVTRSVNLTLS